MTNEELAAEGTAILKMLHERGVCLTDALTAVTAALATLSVKYGVSKAEYLENTERAFDLATRLGRMS